MILAEPLSLSGLGVLASILSRILSFLIFQRPLPARLPPLPPQGDSFQQMESLWPIARFSSSGPQVYCRASSQPSQDILPQHCSSYRFLTTSMKPSVPIKLTFPPIRGVPLSSPNFNICSQIWCPAFHACFVSSPQRGPLALMYQAAPALPALPIGFTPPQQPQSPEGYPPSLPLEPHYLLSLCSLPALSTGGVYGGCGGWIPSWMALVVRQIQSDSVSSFPLSGHLYICLSNHFFLTLGIVTSRIVYPGRTYRLHSQCAKSIDPRSKDDGGHNARPESFLKASPPPALPTPSSPS